MCFASSQEINKDLTQLLQFIALEVRTPSILRALMT